MARRRIGEILVEAGALTDAQLQQALAQQKQTGGRLGRVLVDAGFVTETQVVTSLSHQLGLPAARFPAEMPGALLDVVPIEVCERHGVFPLAIQRDAKGEILTLAMVDPTNIEIIDSIQFRTGRRVIPTIAGETATLAAIRRHYYGEAPRVDVTPQSPAQFAGHEVELELAPEDEIPVVTGVLTTPARPFPAASLPAAPPPAPPAPAPIAAPASPAPPPPKAFVAPALMEASAGASDSMFGSAGGFLGPEEDEFAPSPSLFAPSAAPAPQAEPPPVAVSLAVEAPPPPAAPSHAASAPPAPGASSPPPAAAASSPPPIAAVIAEPEAGVEEILDLDASSIIPESADGAPPRTRTATGPLPPVPPRARTITGPPPAPSPPAAPPPPEATPDVAVSASAPLTVDVTEDGAVDVDVDIEIDAAPAPAVIEVGPRAVVEAPAAFAESATIDALEQIEIAEAMAFGADGTVEVVVPAPAGTPAATAPLAAEPAPTAAVSVAPAPLEPVHVEPAPVETPHVAPVEAAPALCPGCGATRLPGAKFCPMCGQSFTGAARAQSSPPASAPPEPPSAPPAEPPMPSPPAPSAPAPLAPLPAPPAPSLRAPLTVAEIETLEGLRGAAETPRTSEAGGVDELTALRGEPTNGLGVALTQLAFIRAEASVPDDVDALLGAIRALPGHLVASRADERGSLWGDADDLAVLVAGAPPPRPAAPDAAPTTPSLTALAADWRDVAEKQIPRKDNRTDVAAVPRAREVFMPAPDDAMPPPIAAAEPKVTYTPAAIPAVTGAPAPWAAFASPAHTPAPIPPDSAPAPDSDDKKPGK